MAGKVFGITVMPEWIQVEGIEPLLDNLARAGVTAVATSPYVMEPVADGQGGREPPIDAGAGKVRLLDRDLWGRREIWCRTSPSFVPEAARYEGLRYRPAEPSGLTLAEGPKVGAFIRAAKARGLEVHLQVQAAIPPGYRVQFGGPEADDQPMLPDGSFVAERVDKNGSLASPHIVAYGEALLADLARAYPEIDALRVDWPEYPPYTLDSWFTDFGPHARAAGARLGNDMERLAAEALAVRAELLAGDTGRLAELLAGRCLAELWHLKADLAVAMLDAYRAALPAPIRLIAHAFPPPWARLGGMDYARVGQVVQGLGVKLYTMHWPMMLRQYGETMAKGRPGEAEGSLARALVAAFATGGPEPGSLADLRYPEPEEPHPAGDIAMAAKIAAAQAASGGCPAYAFAHSYGPLADVERRVRAAWQASANGVWVNRYGYCSNAKLDAFARIVQTG